VSISGLEGVEAWALEAGTAIRIAAADNSVRMAIIEWIFFM